MRRLAVFIFGAAMLALLSTGAGAGIRVDFPKDDSVPYDKIGVFIGINQYPRMPEFNLNGCVTDAMGMRETFGHLGVLRYAMLTDEQATRAAIGQVLRELVDQVQRGTAKIKKPVTVVITYAGHGSRVKRLAIEKDDTLDDTWVASDSDMAGSRDIRGYELEKLHMQLARLGAQVVLISDSCHSGSIYRDSGKVRGLPFRDSEIQARLGPQDDLFPEFSVDQSVGKIRFGNSDQMLPGFVSYSACGDWQRDREAQNDKMEPCGPLSLVLEKLLTRIGTKWTYQDIAVEIAAEFRTRFPDFTQRPEFHAAFGKADELFLQGGFAPPHANIVKGTLEDGEAELTMGGLLGVRTGTRFRFYANVGDLAEKKKVAGEGVATAVDPITCRVKLDDGAEVNGESVAIPDEISVDDFSVATEGNIPDFVMAKLKELVQDHRIELADSLEKSSVVVRYDPTKGVVNLYSPKALPPMGREDSSVPMLRPAIVCRSADETEALASNLLYAARIQRLFSVEHADDGLLKAEVVTPGAAERFDSGGVRRVAENQRVTIRLSTSEEDSRLYITIMTLDPVGNLVILFPEKGREAPALTPGQPREVTFDAEIDDPSKLSSGEAEVSVMKVLATDRPFDFSPLAVPPVTGAVNVPAARGGSDSAMFDFMRDILHGGAMVGRVARGDDGDLVSQKWATVTLCFGVEKK